jgi:hypothetical protein
LTNKQKTKQKTVEKNKLAEQKVTHAQMIQQWHTFSILFSCKFNTRNSGHKATMAASNLVNLLHDTSSHRSADTFTNRTCHPTNDFVEISDRNNQHRKYATPHTARKKYTKKSHTYSDINDEQKTVGTYRSKG